MARARRTATLRNRVLGPLAAALSARMARWVRKRQGPDQLPVTLERRRLYILPTRAGLAFAALLFLMLLAGLNYANSLALFLTFLLTAFALVAMQQCHRNLLGAELTAAIAPAVFAHTPGRLDVTLASRGPQARLRLEAALPGGEVVSADVAAHEQEHLALPVSAPRRGRVRLERLRLATAHPFGLFRTWTWVHAPLEMVIYPQPRGSLPLPSYGAHSSGQRAHAGAGADEWATLRPFRDGDSPRQVDWKAYAREAPLLVKEYTQAQSEQREFDFDRLAGLDLEARLSQLARWVVDAEAHGERYALSLPGLRVPPDRGPEHRHRCLAALALYGLDTEA